MTAINPAIAAAIAKAKAAEDQSKVVQGGGEYTPPAAGKTTARLVGYFELGKEQYDYKGTPKTKDKVRLVFELTGKQHAAKEIEVNGAKVLIPVRLSININKSFGENGKWRKLFAKLNYDGSITHAAERIGHAFLVEVVHSKSKDGKVTYANLDNEAGEFLIGAARIPVMDEDTGEMSEKALTVPPALTDTKMFLWDFCDKAMWDSIFIDGEYPERVVDGVTVPGKSKNVIQNEIKAADNYIGSPIYDILAGAGEELDIADAETAVSVGAVSNPPPAVEQTGADDPLAGM